VLVIFLVRVDLGVGEVDHEVEEVLSLEEEVLDLLGGRAGAGGVSLVLAG